MTLGMLSSFALPFRVRLAIRTCGHWLGIDKGTDNLEEDEESDTFTMGFTSRIETLMESRGMLEMQSRATIKLRQWRCDGVFLGSSYVSSGLDGVGWQLGIRLTSDVLDCLQKLHNGLVRCGRIFCKQGGRDELGGFRRCSQRVSSVVGGRGGESRGGAAVELA
nr:hypothetical protein Iba_chr15aCG12620 [Ipomoea batatas]GMD97901.1 hypothetical protein Iba_chr15cCG7000 [Ipomoea batatas]